MAKLHYVNAQDINEILAEAEQIRPQNASVTITLSQACVLIGAAIPLAIFLLAASQLALVAFIAICVIGFTVQFVFKSHLTFASLGSMVTIDQEWIDGLNERDLPMYTVLVPLRGEEGVIHQLVKSLSNLDYPTNRLQIMILLEENDPATVRAAKQIQLPKHFQVLVLADAGPRTKPKACTVGLQYAQGDFVVVFDAEDLPEPDQLKKVVLAYWSTSGSAWCIQAKLEYHNTYQNLLTRLFSGEYITHFNLTLPALGANNMLVPLGGTSNHFRTDILRSLGGWDPFNVTEDLDLGILIKRRGGIIHVIDSVTWEEANARVGLFGKGGWVSQRSRWIKGHMQAYLVHMRNPWQLLRDLGPKNFMVFQIIVGGAPVALLLSPAFLLLTAVYIASRTLLPSLSPEAALALQNAIEALFPSRVYYLAVGSFILGNLGIMYYHMIGCMMRRQYANVKWMLLAPVYWLLMSIATWKAFKQLITNPHYWEKTQHHGPSAQSHGSQHEDHYEEIESEVVHHRLG